ncbi:DUF7409 domain-containing protein [Halohasta salina]|uniref:DUF7409 domain-containing protein n=1 Tax=Halohasta salina TaxID=2961621 RepID=UPI0020A3DBDE|nr:helix-hairpin-helix domain-containing protein [Halohasta salina]
MSDESSDDAAVDALQSVRFVGPATASTLADHGYDATAITDKRVSYRLLVDAGVNPGVAAKIRREHSLSWSFDSGGDLDRRSAQIRGLGAAEAEWVAASAGDWAVDNGAEASDAAESDDADAAESDDADAAESDDTDDGWPTEPTPWPTHGEVDTAASSTAATDGSGDAISAEAAWRARSKPTPVSELDAVDEAAVDRLAEAGITSVRSLATADAEHVADVLGLKKEIVDGWYQAAQDAYGQS